MIKGIIRSKDDLMDVIHEIGILPFFANSVEGWSIEEHIDPTIWFTDQEGPWEWKGQLASARKCVYGKFIRNKAAFISPVWFADLANWRRDGYDWEGLVDDGKAYYKDVLLMQYLDKHPGVLSKYAKQECGFTKGYDTVVTRLQMLTFVVLSDFRYNLTKEGIPYGWGNAVIDQADRWLGAEMLETTSCRTPAESFELMIRHLLRIMPNVNEDILRKELK